MKGLPKGLIFPLTRDDLIECAAMVRAARDGELDRIRIPGKPLDVLAQQIVAETAAEEWDEDALLSLLRGAYPYRDLTREEFDDVVAMLAAGYTTRRGRRAALVHHDAINRKLRARRGSRMIAITSGGAIPEVFDYRVLLEPEGVFIGTLNEDFAIESLPGDIFQLGNTSWRIIRIDGGVVRGPTRKATASMPFCSAKGLRAREVSAAVSRLRSPRCAVPGPDKPARTESSSALSRGSSRTTSSRALPPSRSQHIWPREAGAWCRARAQRGGRALLREAEDDLPCSPIRRPRQPRWDSPLRKKLCQSFNFEPRQSYRRGIYCDRRIDSFPLTEVGVTSSNTCARR